MANSVANTNELVEEVELSVTDGGPPLLTAKEHKSGEEKYNVIYEEKAKLFRFDEGENAWKERGQGSARILQKKDEPGVFMFVFRREAIGKLGAQHFLIKGMNVKVHSSNEKTLTWRAGKDYVDDDEGYPESFLMRFATKELADKAVEQMQKAINLSTS
ncbi:ran-binding protein 1 [Angomonas deanei]|uniref:RanBP1 domain containing protein, putative n=1 Tax=Angomonas deanei TaxID=59799 RepID=S9WQG0_9TRYP|nr:ran-binding protein 1 [Angomonas deanei]EPY42392.1 ran-binding protein 1 [Angomonas deanei]CAD2219661.1 RanBP1 domain containing protein, putative [Angomonas deanei]|eukprot:EPY41576.1 ran-binding protein 1 [Angomonas deanei]